MATRLWAKQLEFEYRHEARNSSHHTVQTGSETHQVFVERVPEALSLGGKVTGA
jgi:hypothetical protein